MGFRSGLYGGRYLQMMESGTFVLAVDLPSGINTKSTFPYICIANKGKCFCLAHYEVTIAKDTVNSQ